MRCYWTWGGGGMGTVSECSGHSIFFFMKESWICVMTRHAEPNIDILWTRNLPFDSDV